ncbi:MAG: hypothetical protein ACR2HF_12615 [Methylococcaceae bacterium]
MHIRTSALDRITTLSDPARYLESLARKDERRIGNEASANPNLTEPHSTGGSDSRGTASTATITQVVSNQAQKALNVYGHLQKSLTSEDQLAYGSMAGVDYYA